MPIRGMTLTNRTTSSLAAAVIGLMVVLMLVLGPVLGSPGAAAGPLSAEDADALKAALKAVDDNGRQRAVLLSRKIKDPLARKILQWARLRKPDPKADFIEIAAFMAANPGWPDRRLLQRQAEEAMTSKTPDDVVLAWFADHAPISGYGMARLGQALVAVGEEKEGRKILKDAWIGGNFTKVRERAFYKRHRRLLSLEDHRRRLDRLLWEGRYWPVRRMLWKVKPDYRALSMARMMLRQRRGNVDTAIAKVPDELKNHPGLIYERLRWRRRKGKDASALELLEKLPGGLAHPERWWVERRALTRRALQKGHVTDAYRIVKGHGLESGGAFAEAEWLAGWIALRFLGDDESAMIHFQTMYQSVKYPVSIARSTYWTARALEAQGAPELAEMWHRIAAAYPTTYYGQLSLARLHPGAALNLRSDPEAGEDEKKAFEAHELVRAVGMLGQAGDYDRLRPFILHLDKMAETPGWRRLAGELARRNQRPDLAVMVAKRAHRDGLNFPEIAFPTLLPPLMNQTSGKPPVEVPLILAVVRQESAFNVKAKSHANAQGLMQLLPRTAFKVAKRLKVPFSRRRLTTDGVYNLTLGQAYLFELMGEFKGSLVLTLAAYNAGSGRVRRWIRNYGDPREADTDAIDWVEMIPFKETRNYVQRVLENLQVYRRRLAQTEIALTLENDLHK